MAFLTNDRYLGWKSHLFISSPRGQKLVRLELDGARVVKEQAPLKDQRSRIRDVRQGHDGWLYVLTASDDGQTWWLKR